MGSRRQGTQEKILSQASKGIAAILNSNFNLTRTIRKINIQEERISRVVTIANCELRTANCLLTVCA